MVPPCLVTGLASVSGLGTVDFTCKRHCLLSSPAPSRAGTHLARAAKHYRGGGDCRRNARRGKRAAARGSPRQGRGFRLASDHPSGGWLPLSLHLRWPSAAWCRLADSGTEAVAARAVRKLSAQGSLGRYEPVAEGPGFARAVAAVLNELRLAQMPVGGLDPAAAELQRLLETYDAELAMPALPIGLECLRQRQPRQQRATSCIRC